MTLDLISKLRADTAACENLLHFNNAGMSLTPQPVTQAVLDHLALEQAVGGYAAQADAMPLIEDFYAAFSDMLGANPLEIAFMESATKAWDAVFYSLPLSVGDRVMVHSSTYSSNYLALIQLARRKGLEIDFMPSDSHGQIDVAALPNIVQSRTKLVLLTHCPSQSGLIQPAAAIGKFAKAHGLLYLLDACQSAGQMPLNVDEIGCDALTGTGRKFLRGPRGTGFLYMRRELAEKIEPHVVDLQASEWTHPDKYELAPGARRFEAWERSVAGQIGLGRAVRYAIATGLDVIANHVQPLAALLRRELSGLAGVTVYDPGQKKSGIVTFNKEGVAVDKAKAVLRAQAINISVVPQSWALLDVKERNLPDLMRASLHAYNTETEISRFIEAVHGL